MIYVGVPEPIPCSYQGTARPRPLPSAGSCSPPRFRDMSTYSSRQTLPSSCRARQKAWSQPAKRQRGCGREEEWPRAVSLTALRPFEPPESPLG